MIGGSNKLLSPAETARYLGISVRTLRRRRAEWGLPVHRVGNEIKFRVRDIEKFIEGSRIK